MTSRRTVENLLLELFTAEDLRRHLTYLPDGDRISAQLPGMTASLAQVAHKAVEVLDQMGILRQDEFWRMLLDARPGRRADIEEVRQAARPQTGVKRLLFVSASPRGEPHLATDFELRRLRESLERPYVANRIEVLHRPAADYATLEQALLSLKPDLLHLSCHGDSAGNLMLANERDDPEPIPPKMFTGLIKALPFALELVVVNACHSTIVASMLPPTVAAAIGMRTALHDEAAIDFSSTLYRNLAIASSVPQAFKVVLNRLISHGAEGVPQLFLR